MKEISPTISLIFSLRVITNRDAISFVKRNVIRYKIGPYGMGNEGKTDRTLERRYIECQVMNEDFYVT